MQMPSKDEAQKALDEMNGKFLSGRSINVSEARPRTEGRRGGGGGGGRGGGGRRRF